MEITYYANKIKTLTLNPQSFAKGQCACGWKINCGTEACTVLRKAQEFSKAKASIIQESGATTDIMIILIFHTVRHLLGNHIASLLHTVNIIFCSLSSRVAAVTAATVSNCSSLSWPAEATRAARDSQRRWPPQCSQRGFPRRRRVPRAGANRLRMALCRWFKARLPVLVITQRCTTTRTRYPAQLRTEAHYSKWLSRKTGKRKYDFCLNAVMLMLLVKACLWHSLNFYKIISAIPKLYSLGLGYPFAQVWKKDKAVIKGNGQHLGRSNLNSWSWNLRFTETNRRLTG